MGDLQQSLDLEWGTPGVRTRGELPGGLRLVPAYVDPSDERELVAAIDAQPWSTSMSRRVQHYGWRYDYRRRQVTPDAYLGPLPGFLEALARRVGGDFGFEPDQAIVNEYEPGQGIAPHVDCEPCFGRRVAMVGLGSDVQMDFQHVRSGAVGSILFARRALVLLEGSARTEWTHAIQKRRSDPEYRVRRSRRLSVTFRTVLVDRGSRTDPTGD